MENIISIENLSFDYPDKKGVLKNINLNIEAGENVAIIGRNGAGKSTLLMNIIGILSGIGEIEIFGLKLKKENLSEIRRRIGFVFQNPDDQLFMPTIFDDISFGPLNFGYSEEETQRKVKDVLKLVGLENYDFRKPHHLSMGEKKRAALATVLVFEPEAIIFDEPMLALDPSGRNDFIQFIKYIKSAKIIATHDLEMAMELCSRVILMDNGKIVADGNTREILADNKLMNNTGIGVPLSLSL
ncbi:energy-coupling factor ABC transporter ATP-binding protein [candidate division KSB1 bacterium]